MEIGDITNALQFEQAVDNKELDLGIALEWMTQSDEIRRIFSEVLEDIPWCCTHQGFVCHLAFQCGMKEKIVAFNNAIFNSTQDLPIQDSKELADKILEVTKNTQNVSLIYLLADKSAENLRDLDLVELTKVATQANDLLSFDMLDLLLDRLPPEIAKKFVDELVSTQMQDDDLGIFEHLISNRYVGAISKCIALSSERNKKTFYQDLFLDLCPCDPETEGEIEDGSTILRALVKHCPPDSWGVFNRGTDSLEKLFHVLVFSGGPENLQSIKTLLEKCPPVVLLECYKTEESVSVLHAILEINPEDTEVIKLIIDHCPETKFASFLEQNGLYSVFSEAGEQSLQVYNLLLSYIMRGVTDENYEQRCQWVDQLNRIAPEFQASWVLETSVEETPFGICLRNNRYDMLGHVLSAAPGSKLNQFFMPLWTRRVNNFDMDKFLACVPEVILDSVISTIHLENFIGVSDNVPLPENAKQKVALLKRLSLLLQRAPQQRSEQEEERFVQELKSWPLQELFESVQFGPMIKTPMIIFLMNSTLVGDEPLSSSSPCIDAVFSRPFDGLQEELSNINFSGMPESCSDWCLEVILKHFPKNDLERILTKPLNGNESIIDYIERKQSSTLFLLVALNAKIETIEGLRNRFSDELLVSAGQLLAKIENQNAIQKMNLPADMLAYIELGYFDSVDLSDSEAYRQKIVDRPQDYIKYLVHADKLFTHVLSKLDTVDDFIFSPCKGDESIISYCQKHAPVKFKKIVTVMSLDKLKEYINQVPDEDFPNALFLLGQVPRTVSVLEENPRSKPYGLYQRIEKGILNNKDVKAELRVLLDRYLEVLPHHGVALSYIFNNKDEFITEPMMRKIRSLPPEKKLKFLPLLTPEEIYDSVMGIDEARLAEILETKIYLSNTHVTIRSAINTTTSDILLLEGNSFAPLALGVAIRENPMAVMPMFINPMFSVSESPLFSNSPFFYSSYGPVVVPLMLESVDVVSRMPKVVCEKAYHLATERQKKILDARIKILSASESINNEDFATTDRLMDELLQDPTVSMPLIVRDTTVTHYLIDKKREKIAEYIRAKGGFSQLSQTERENLLPFLTPSEVKGTVLATPNTILANLKRYEDLTGTPPELFEAFANQHIIFNADPSVVSLFCEKFLRSFSPLEIALVAQDTSDVVATYLPYMSFDQLSVTIPLLPIDLLLKFSYDERSQWIRYATKEQKTTVFQTTSLLPEKTVRLQKAIEDAQNNEEESLTRLQGYMNAISVQYKSLARLASSYGEIHITPFLSTKTGIPAGPYTNTSEGISVQERFDTVVTHIQEAEQKGVKHLESNREEEIDYPAAYLDPVTLAPFQRPYKLPNGMHLEEITIRGILDLTPEQPIPQNKTFKHPTTREEINTKDCKLSTTFAKEVARYTRLERAVFVTEDTDYRKLVENACKFGPITVNEDLARITGLVPRVYGRENKGYNPEYQRRLEEKFNKALEGIRIARHKRPAEDPSPPRRRRKISE